MTSHYEAQTACFACASDPTGTALVTHENIGPLQTKATVRLNAAKRAKRLVTAVFRKICFALPVRSSTHASS